MMDEVIFDFEERLTSLSQPDVLLPDQYFATFRRRRMEPEKKLMLAALEDAVNCFQRYVSPRNRKERALFNETEAWICDENGSDLFSFVNICEVCNLNPDYVRKGLLCWKRRKRAELQKLQLINIPSAVQQILMGKCDGAIIEIVKRPCRENKVARMD
jgi:hypothetical protein